MVTSSRCIELQKTHKQATNDRLTKVYCTCKFCCKNKIHQRHIAFKKISREVKYSTSNGYDASHNKPEIG